MLASLLCALLLATPAPAAPVELKQETLQAFGRYVSIREAEIDRELGRGNPFLWVDRLPEARRQAAFAELRVGRVVIERLEVRDHGQKIGVPDGLIHHWISTVYIPGAALRRTLALVQDYDKHQVYYAPDVQRSKLLAHNGNEFKIYLRFLKKKGHHRGAEHRARRPLHAFQPDADGRAELLDTRR